MIAVKLRIKPAVVPLRLPEIEPAVHRDQRRVIRQEIQDPAAQGSLPGIARVIKASVHDRRDRPVVLQVQQQDHRERAQAQRPYRPVPFQEQRQAQEQDRDPVILDVDRQVPQSRHQLPLVAFTHGNGDRRQDRKRNAQHGQFSRF